MSRYWMIALGVLWTGGALAAPLSTYEKWTERTIKATVGNEIYPSPYSATEIKGMAACFRKEKLTLADLKRFTAGETAEHPPLRRCYDKLIGL